MVVREERGRVGVNEMVSNVSKSSHQDGAFLTGGWILLFNSLD